MANLKVLMIWNNRIEGEIPPALGNLTELEVLNFNDAGGLDGNIPPELGNLTKLRNLQLSSNQLSGEIPTELGNLKNLNYLSLLGNQLSGQIPAELGNLTNQWRIYLHSNQLTGEIPRELGNLEQAGIIALRGNQLIGEIPRELDNLRAVAKILLEGNQLTGCVPDVLLEVIIDFDLPLCGVPHHQEDVAALIAIYQATGGEQWTDNTNWLSDEPLGEWFGVSTDSAGRVVRLQLWANYMKGEIPPELAQLDELDQLVIPENELNG